MNLPKAKYDNIVVQNLNNEVLIYNLTTDQAFCLNETSAKVFNCCDGNTTFDELKRKHKFTDDLIRFALDELQQNDLLENYQSNYFAGLSRREVIKRVGLASMIALPVIAGMVAPQAANAASGACDTNMTCTSSATCPAPCTTCDGIGFCENTAESCFDLNGPCTSTGRCIGADINNFVFGSCDNGRLGGCLTDGDCTVSGTCNGTGNCA